MQLLLSERKCKENFFFKVGEATIFDRDKFIGLVYNKKFLRDSHTRFSEKIGLAVEDKFIIRNPEVVLNWPYKDCMLEGGMTKEDKGRNEIFWNEVIAPEHITRLKSPKAFMNGKSIDAKGSRELKEFKRQDGRINDNLIIKGNNLLALYSLKEQFAGKVKLIYIDPPYNTGGDMDAFTYNNSFNHSGWLTFMKNRLEIAKTLLREDGVIVVAIDHNELFHLGTCMQEIFGRENRLGVISVVHKRGGRNQEKFFASSNEFMLVFAQNREKVEFNKVALTEKYENEFKFQDDSGKYRKLPFLRDHVDNLREKKTNSWYPIYVSKDLKNISLDAVKGYHKVLPISNTNREMSWQTNKEAFLESLDKGDIIADKEGDKIIIYRKSRVNQIVKTHWDDSRYNNTHYGTRLLERMLGKKTVSYIKSIHTVKDVLKIMTSANDIVMDFFAGSGTTGHATLALNKEDGANRQFILVEQLEMHIDTCLKRMKKVVKNEYEVGAKAAKIGGGGGVFCIYGAC